MHTNGKAPGESMEVSVCAVTIFIRARTSLQGDGAGGQAWDGRGRGDDEGARGVCAGVVSQSQ